MSDQMCVPSLTHSFGIATSFKLVDLIVFPVKFKMSGYLCSAVCSLQTMMFTPKVDGSFFNSIFTSFSNDYPTNVFMSLEHDLSVFKIPQRKNSSSFSAHFFAMSNVAFYTCTLWDSFSPLQIWR
ncbi:hypothetical protein O6H91_20G026100 [Diphasiastrum complanatum]|uniref:Uncharacterized protein n=1 Tax=Diphasiastrum complanatum TaxID=34168 RepID=A0ACC2ANN9_DIPCM|nr:hypothetical protein O6H91_20G026100 [Diphasiastrum complanatum]